MKPLDRFLQKYRIRQAAPYILPGASVLDIGCYDGGLFLELRDRISFYVGIDPVDHQSCRRDGRLRRIVGSFPADLPDLGQFDVITMLAVLEHFPLDQLGALPCHCASRLKPGGALVITMPSPCVDHILEVLSRIRVIDGMSFEEHHGLDPQIVPRIFCREYFDLKVKESFQLGLNNLLVFQKKGRHL